MMSFCLLTIIFGLFLVVSARSIPTDLDARSSSLPIVDLGYQRQQATLYNSSGAYYNFSNIRYAAPPTGKDRFNVPKPPEIDRSTVQTGSPDVICPQGTPKWLNIANEFLTYYLAGETQFNSSSFNGTNRVVPRDPRETEDCLFLDVDTPKAIFDNAGKGKGAPVIVWIYGGGYTTGSKTYWGNPAGLIDRSELNGQEGIIYVSMNYRLGAFGFLSGPTFGSAGGIPNAGLYDQRFALDWVQKYIHLFGGDPDRVTVLGESAGGGSIMHQITAYGGSKPPFAQAIMQSPAFFPIVSNQVQERTYDSFLSILGVSTLDEARQLPSEKIQAANAKQVENSVYGQYTYGPVVGGDFAPALPGQLLLEGRYPKDLKVMVGHNQDEGILFTSPFISNNSAFAEEVQSLLPTVKAWPAVQNYIENTLYPANFDGSEAMNYTNQIARAAAMIGEANFICNTFYLNKAYGNKTYSYEFSVPPAIHGLDIPYTYFNGPSPAVLSVPVALALQKYITRFAETGSPNEKGVPHFGMYGSNAMLQNLNITGITQIKDEAANSRCDWWQKALYY